MVEELLCPLLIKRLDLIERFKICTYAKFVEVKVIRKFFLRHNKSFRWHLGDYEKHIFFPFEGL